VAQHVSPPPPARARRRRRTAHGVRAGRLVAPSALASTNGSKRPGVDKWLKASWRRWNPLAPDLSYRLDLSERDGALVARALVELAVSEPGENWAAEALDGAPLAGPSAFWADRMPAAGTLEVPPRARPRAPGRRAAG